MALYILFCPTDRAEECGRLHVFLLSLVRLLFCCLVVHFGLIFIARICPSNDAGSPRSVPGIYLPSRKEFSRRSVIALAKSNWRSERGSVHRDECCKIFAPDYLRLIHVMLFSPRESVAATCFKAPQRVPELVKDRQ